MGMLIRKHFSNNVEVEEVVLPSPEEDAYPKYTKAQIGKMSLNQMKKLAISLGIEVGGVSQPQMKKAIYAKLEL